MAKETEIMKPLLFLCAISPHCSFAIPVHITLARVIVFKSGNLIVIREKVIFEHIDIKSSKNYDVFLETTAVASNIAVFLFSIV